MDKVSELFREIEPEHQSILITELFHQELHDWMMEAESVISPEYREENPTEFMGEVILIVPEDDIEGDYELTREPAGLIKMTNKRARLLKEEK